MSDNARQAPVLGRAAAALARLTDKPPLQYLASTIAVIVAGALAWAISVFVLFPHVSALFLFAVVATAILWGLGPSLFAVVLSIGWSAFFIYPPILDFRVFHPQDLLDLTVFSITAVLAALLADEVRKRGEEARRGEATMASLYAFSRSLAAIPDSNQLLFAILEHLTKALRSPVVLLLPVDGRLVVVASELRDRLLDDAVLAAADRLWRTEPVASEPLDHDPGLEWRLRLLHSSGRNVAVLAIKDARFLQPEAASHYLNTMLDHVAAIIERIQLATAIEDARVEAKTEKLREALLNSISHDLKTPLASILGSATALQSFDRLYEREARADLAATIREEAERLNQFIGNVLDLTRIRAGQVQPRFEYVELADIVDSALRRSQRALDGRAIEVALPGDLPMLRLDLFLMEQALVNVLENAAKYSPKGTSIAISATVSEAVVTLDVRDAGLGISSEELEPIFGRFYRGDPHDAKPAGTGLGLAICRAFVEANGGRIEAASSGLGHGATFRMTLPVPAPAISVMADKDE